MRPAEERFSAKEMQPEKRLIDTLAEPFLPE
jgi:hypothetical protein